jgi:hypothetical protein
MIFLTGLATDEVPDGNGMWVSLKTGRGQDYLTGNVFRDWKQGVSGFEGLQG